MVHISITVNAPSGGIREAQRPAFYRLKVMLKIKYSNNVLHISVHLTIDATSRYIFPWNRKNLNTKIIFDLLPFFISSTSRILFKKITLTLIHLKNFLNDASFHYFLIRIPEAHSLGWCLCFNSNRLNNTKNHLVCEVTSIEPLSYWDHYMATLPTHFKIWAKSGGKIYFIHKNPFF